MTLLAYVKFGVWEQGQYTMKKQAVANRTPGWDLLFSRFCRGVPGDEVFLPTAVPHSPHFSTPPSHSLLRHVPGKGLH